MSVHSLRVRGQRTLRAVTSKIRIKAARTNRMPANVSGGRSARPILMNSQVDPQIPQRISQTMRAFIQSFVREGNRLVKQGIFPTTETQGEKIKTQRSQRFSQRN